jgi:hypothetical protein
MGTIKKELGGVEDLLLGADTVEQTRDGQTVVITKLNAKQIPFELDKTDPAYESIHDRIAGIDTAQITTNTNNIAINTANIATNTVDIASNAEAIANLATAQGSIENDTTPAITAIPTVTPVTLTFDEVTPSTDTNIFEFDAVNDEIDFKQDASFNFSSTVNFTNVSAASLATISFDFVDVSGPTILGTQTVELNIAIGSSTSVSLNTLLTVGKNGIPSSPLSIRLEASSDLAGYKLDSFTSILASSSSYNLTTDASGINYNNTDSGLLGDNIQDAVDEVADRKMSLAASTVLDGDVTLSNTASTLSDGTFLFTGNGTTVDVPTGLSTIDFCVASNGTGFWHDRGTSDCTVRNDAGTLVESGLIAFKDVVGIDGVSTIKIKGRSGATGWNWFDGIRGVLEKIGSELSTAEAPYADSLTAFTATGFTVGAATNVNTNLATYDVEQTLYTHIKWGVTDNVKWIEAFNPITNKGMRLREGSDSQITLPHSLSSEIKYNVTKELNGTTVGLIYYGSTAKTLYLFAGANGDDAAPAYTGWSLASNLVNDFTFVGGDVYTNAAGGIFIDYYEADSETRITKIYSGTGVIGNSFEVKNSAGDLVLPAKVVIKSINIIGSHFVFDNKRDSFTSRLQYDLASAETTDTLYIEASLGEVTIKSTSTQINANGYQYMAIIEADTNKDGGGSYFANPSNTSNAQIVDGQLIYSNGYKLGGARNSGEVFTGTKTLIPSNGWGA